MKLSLPANIQNSSRKTFDQKNEQVQINAWSTLWEINVRYVSNKNDSANFHSVVHFSLGMGIAVRELRNIQYKVKGKDDLYSIFQYSISIFDHLLSLHGLNWLINPYGDSPSHQHHFPRAIQLISCSWETIILWSHQFRSDVIAISSICVEWCIQTAVHNVYR